MAAAPPPVVTYAAPTPMIEYIAPDSAVPELVPRVTTASATGSSRRACRKSWCWRSCCRRFPRLCCLTPRPLTAAVVTRPSVLRSCPPRPWEKFKPSLANMQDTGYDSNTDSELWEWVQVEKDEEREKEPEMMKVKELRVVEQEQKKLKFAELFGDSSSVASWRRSEAFDNQILVADAWALMGGSGDHSGGLVRQVAGRGGV